MKKIGLVIGLVLFFLVTPLAQAGNIAFTYNPKIRTQELGVGEVKTFSIDIKNTTNERVVGIVKGFSDNKVKAFGENKSISPGEKRSLQIHLKGVKSGNFEGLLRVKMSSKGNKEPSLGIKINGRVEREESISWKILIGVIGVISSIALAIALMVKKYVRGSNS